MINMKKSLEENLIKELDNLCSEFNIKKDNHHSYWQEYEESGCAEYANEEFAKYVVYSECISSLEKIILKYRN